jgi:methylated-DNA-[protein]-cysteine S-methyltransferase
VFTRYLIESFMLKVSKKIYVMPYQSPLGAMLLAASADGAVGAWFEGQKHEPTSEQRATWITATNNSFLHALEAWFTNYFVALNSVKTPESKVATTINNLQFDLSLGTIFQQKVWRALCEIPEGETVSYGALASKLGKPSAARAVGAAVGKNPLSVIIPCHRVVGANGALTGYAGGIERKQALLKLEISRSPALYVGAFSSNFSFSTGSNHANTN